jgi:hypothetical protein
MSQLSNADFKKFLTPMRRPEGQGGGDGGKDEQGFKKPQLKHDKEYWKEKERCGVVGSGSAWVVGDVMMFLREMK